jgi:hypothetical protein
MIAPRSLRLLVVPVFLGAALLVRAEPPASAKNDGQGKFIRIQRDGKDQPSALETAVVRYAPAGGERTVSVDLIGAVHVADRAYYDKLNKLFENYDVLLYELVAPPGTRIEKGGKKSDNPLALLQHLMKSILDLDLQTERVDYTKKNFVHADMSPDQMAEAMRKRGETGLTLIFNIFADMMRQQNLQELKKQQTPAKNKDSDDLDVFSMLFDPDSGLKLKRAMADQLAELGGGGGLGNTLTNILITDRNQAAVKVLEKEIAKGHKRIGIFYGVAHLPDFDKRLRENLGFKRTSEQWLTAWDLQSAKKGSGGLLQKLLEQ